MASWFGLDEVLSAFTKVNAQADASSKAIVAKSAALVEKQAKANFSGAHKKGEPHVGGNQPNVVTGTLRRSITHDPVRRTGAFEWGTQVKPTVIYSRRVELGMNGKGAYPYFGPGVETARKQFEAIAAAEWARFLRP